MTTRTWLKAMLGLASVCLQLIPPLAAADPPPPFSGPFDVTVTNPVIPVEVSNANAIPVDEVRAPSREPFQRSCMQPDEVCSWLIPEGKRLVVEFVSGLNYVRGGAIHACVAVYWSLDPYEDRARILIPTQLWQEVSGTRKYLFSAPVRLYADGGPTSRVGIQGVCEAGYFSDETMSAMLVGHLVDMP